MKLSLVRKVATGFLLVDVLAIGAAAVQVQDVVASTTTPTPGGVPAAAPPSGQQLASGAVPGPVGAPAPVAVPPAGGGVPLAVAPAVEPADPAGTKKPSSGGKKPTPAPPATDAPDGGDVPAGRSIPPCPIKLSESPPTGGLQSLVPFAPAFGPFSAEAFALASAYQPELELLGPILAQYPGIEPAVAPVMTPLVSTLGTLLSRGLDVVAPLYGPYRTKFLEAETKLAAALAPYSQALAHNELGGCIVELQSALLAASKGGTPGLPKLTAADLAARGLGGAR